MAQRFGSGLTDSGIHSCWQREQTQTRCFTQFGIGIFRCEDCCINGHSGMFHHVEGKPIWSHDRERQLEAERQGKGDS